MHGQLRPAGVAEWGRRETGNMGAASEMMDDDQRDGRMDGSKMGIGSHIPRDAILIWSKT